MALGDAYGVWPASFDDDNDDEVLCEGAGPSSASAVAVPAVPLPAPAAVHQAHVAPLWPHYSDAEREWLFPPNPVYTPQRTDEILYVLTVSPQRLEHLRAVLTPAWYRDVLLAEVVRAPLPEPTRRMLEGQCRWLRSAITCADDLLAKRMHAGAATADDVERVVVLYLYVFVWLVHVSPVVRGHWFREHQPGPPPPPADATDTSTDYVVWGARATVCLVAVRDLVDAHARGVSGFESVRALLYHLFHVLYSDRVPRALATPTHPPA